MKPIDGKSLATQFRKRVHDAVAAADVTPGLTSILVGHDPASEMYLKLKSKAALEAGIHFEKATFEQHVLQDEVETRIMELNDDDKVHGILIQLPLPQGIDADEVIQSMDPAKDVDGFHPLNLEALESGQPVMRPVLVKAVMRLLDTVTPSYEGKHVVMLGKSDVFLRPFKYVFEHVGAMFTQASTPEPSMTMDADILVTALGQAHVIGEEHVKEGVTIVDVGTSPSDDGVLGDVDPDAVKDKAAFLTPVPGGVGPMTVAMLMENTALAADIDIHHEGVA